MATPRILHMLTPLKHMSPFDVNMGLDAGFDHAIPYTNVTVEDVMFTRNVVHVEPGLRDDVVGVVEFGRLGEMGDIARMNDKGWFNGKSLDLVDRFLERARPYAVPGLRGEVGVDRIEGHDGREQRGLRQSLAPGAHRGLRRAQHVRQPGIGEPRLLQGAHARWRQGIERRRQAEVRRPRAPPRTAARTTPESSAMVRTRTAVLGDEPAVDLGGGVPLLAAMGITRNVLGNVFFLRSPTSDQSSCCSSSQPATGSTGIG